MTMSVMWADEHCEKERGELQRRPDALYTTIRSVYEKHLAATKMSHTYKHARIKHLLSSQLSTESKI